MKQLTKETQADLEAIRHKVEKKDPQWTQREILHLQEVNREVLAMSNIKQNTIDGGCGGCVTEAVNTVYNFITYHEQRPDNREAKVLNVSAKPAKAKTTTQATRKPRKPRATKPKSEPKS